MKTIIDSSNCSKYLLSDDVVVDLGSESTKIGNPVQIVVFDINSSNATIVERVNEPEDWVGGKYNYVNGAWELCPNWVDFRLNEKPKPLLGE